MGSVLRSVNRTDVVHRTAGRNQFDAEAAHSRAESLPVIRRGMPMCSHKDERAEIHPDDTADRALRYECKPCGRSIQVRRRSRQWDLPH